MHVSYSSLRDPKSHVCEGISEMWGRHHILFIKWFLMKGNGRTYVTVYGLVSHLHLKKDWHTRPLTYGLCKRVREQSGPVSYLPWVKTQHSHCCPAWKPWWVQWSHVCPSAQSPLQSSSLGCSSEWSQSLGTQRECNSFLSWPLGQVVIPQRLYLIYFTRTWTRTWALT